MKKIALCLALIIALLVPGAVLATEPEGIGSLPLVEMNGTEYASIADAIANIEDNTEATTIKLLTNVTDGAGFVVPEGSNIIFDFNGFTYNVTSLVGSTGTETIGCQLLKNSSVVFQNGTLTSTTAKMLVQNYSDLTLIDMTLDATASAENTYVLSNNNGNTYITGNTSIIGNKVAFDVCWAPNMGYPNGANVAIDSYGTIKGDIEIGDWGTINDSDKTDVKSSLIINYINHDGDIVVTKDYLKGQYTVNGGAFTDLAGAIAGIRDNSTTTTILLYDNVTDGKGFVVPENSNLEIDFNGCTYNVTSLVGSKGTETLGCQLLKGSTVVLKNGRLTSNTAKMLVQNYSNLTLQNITLDARESEENSYVLSNNQGVTNIIEGTEIYGNKVALDVCWAPNMSYKEGAQVTIDCYGEIVGDIEIGTWGVINDSDKENILSTLTINGINHNGNIDVTKDYLTNQITINGGAFSTDVTEYLAEGLFCPVIDGMYIVKSSAKHKITVIQSEGGTVTVDKTEAQYGEIVKVTVVVNDGYRLVSLECGDDFMGGDIIGMDSFVMDFESDVTITPVFEALPTPEDPTPDEPTPDEPTPDEPTPDEPTPDEPTPDEPTPEDPTPEDPTPDEPTPEEPTPDEPTPDEPTPEEPTPDEPTEDEPTQEIVIPEGITNSEVVEEILLESLNDFAEKIEDENPELAEAIRNNNVEVVVDMAEDIVLPTDEKEVFEELAQKAVADIKVAKYLDITIAVKNKVNNEHLTNLEELQEEITFSVAIPEEILEKEIEEGYMRKYYIVRDHNGKIDVWEVEAKDGELEFSSNLFSVYAIAYKDVPTSAGGPGESEDSVKPEEDNKDDEKLEEDKKEEEEKGETHQQAII